MELKRFLIVSLAILYAICGIDVDALSVSAVSSVVISGDTGEVIYSKNADARLPMASTTKIMTALLLCEYGNLEREITITEEMVAVEGSSMGLLPGDTVSLRTLLYGMLLASGNDAANTVAYLIGGSYENFVELMNCRAAELKMTNTHFVTPSGLDADEHYTTAFDLALLSRAALQNPDFATAAATEYETVYYGNPPYRRTLKNHNRLLSQIDGVIGVKTGYTKKSGRCLVSALKRNGKYVIAVTLNAPEDWNDHKLLLEYGLSRLKKFSSDASELPILNCVNGNINSVHLQAEEVEFSYISDESVTVGFYLPHFIYAPVENGEQLGYIKYRTGEKIIAYIPIYSKNAVEISKITFLKLLKINFLSMLANF